MRLAHLVDTARRELESRRENYPQMIARAAIGREEAERDVLAWSLIATWLDTGAIGDMRHDLTVRDLERAAGRALERRRASCAKSPDHRGLAERRDAIEAIHDRLKHRADMIDDLNTRLRARAEREAA